MLARFNAFGSGEEAGRGAYSPSGSSASEEAAGLQDFLVCIEMVFAALAHVRAFPVKDFLPSEQTAAEEFDGAEARGTFLSDLPIHPANAIVSNLPAATGVAPLSGGSRSPGSSSRTAAARSIQLQSSPRLVTITQTVVSTMPSTSASNAVAGPSSADSDIQVVSAASNSAVTVEASAPGNQPRWTSILQHFNLVDIITDTFHVIQQRNAAAEFDTADQEPQSMELPTLNSNSHASSAHSDQLSPSTGSAVASTLRTNSAATVTSPVQTTASVAIPAAPPSLTDPLLSSTAAASPSPPP